MILLKGYHRHIIDMDGVVVSSTVTASLVDGENIIGLTVHDILPRASAGVFINTMLRALEEKKPQWGDYTVAEQVFVFLIDFLPDKNVFICHETPYVGSTHDIQLRLQMALENFRKMRA